MREVFKGGKATWPRMKPQTGGAMALSRPASGSMDGSPSTGLTINRELWACVEWSPSRRAWCVQDASGRCLAHCDAIHGEHIDASTAVELAKAMIRDGRMPTPEEAARQLRERLDRDRLGEPWEPLPRHFGTHSGCARQ